MLNHRRVTQSKHVYSNYRIDTRRAHSALDLYKKISNKIPDISEVSKCSYLPAPQSLFLLIINCLIVFKIAEKHVHTSSASTMSQCIALVIMAESKGGELTLKLLKLEFLEWILKSDL